MTSSSSARAGCWASAITLAVVVAAVFAAVAAVIAASGKLLDALAAGGNSTGSLTAASWTMAIYATVAIGLAVILFTRRDVPA
jgi:hypothetical protein